MMYRLKGLIYGVISSATFGLIPLFALPAIRNGIGVDSVMFYRFGISALVLGLWLVIRRYDLRISGRELFTLAGLGIFYAMTALLLTTSYLYIPSGIATTIHFLYPVLERYASFWNYMMTKDPVYVQLSYSDEEIRGYMENAGIKNGFFTVKMGDREATQFYSATKTTSPIQSKERYDARYKNLTSGGILLDEYEAGDIFKIGDKEYILSENHTLDIPYGEDIYNLEYPSNYKFGKKVE